MINCPSFVVTSSSLILKILSPGNSFPTDGPPVKQHKYIYKILIQFVKLFISFINLKFQLKEFCEILLGCLEEDKIKVNVSTFM